MSKVENAEQIRVDEMLSRIERARNEALELTELDGRKDIAEAIIGKAFLEGHITGREFKERTDMEDTPQGRLDFKTLEDFEFAMRLLNVDPEILSWTLHHEEQHFEVARKVGFDPYYTIQFAKPGSFYPGVNFECPQDLTDEDLRGRLIQVMEAPEELSPRDRNILGEDSTDAE